MNYLLDGILCSIEIVDFRFQKPINEIGALNLISNNGASDFWIKNDEIFNINEINLNDYEISLNINGQLKEIVNN